MNNKSKTYRAYIGTLKRSATQPPFHQHVDLMHADADADADAGGRTSLFRNPVNTMIHWPGPLLQHSLIKSAFGSSRRLKKNVCLYTFTVWCYVPITYGKSMETLTLFRSGNGKL